jgi:hypothetical protein
MTQALGPTHERSGKEPLDVLREVTATHVRIVERIETVFDENHGALDLDPLRAEVAVMLDELRQRVAQKSPVSPEKVLLPLVCLYDERVLVRAMEPGGDEPWSRLQRGDYAPREDGGDLFYEKLTELVQRANRLAESPPESVDAAEREEVLLLVTLYRFCLAEGFKGRYSGAPDKLESRAEALENALQALVPRRKSVPPKAAAKKAPSWFDRLRARVRGALGLRG